MSTRNRIGIITAAYAVVYATMNGWLRGFYGRATRSIASAIVCGIVTLNLWTGLRAFDETLAFSLIKHWRNVLFIALVLVCAAVDLAFVETGKADRWASVAMDRYSFLKDHHSALCVALIASTLVGFAWPLITG
jgi:hypothetical protein